MHDVEQDPCSHEISFEGVMARGGFDYNVTATGPAGFQVSASHPGYGEHLVGNFRSLAAAERFAEGMRGVDTGPSHGAVDYETEPLVRRLQSN